MRAGNEQQVGRPCLRVRGPHRLGHERVVGGQVADRVGAGGVAGELERLAAAPAEVQLAAVAAPAGSGIQSVPRNAVITGASAQIRASGSSRTLARGNGRDCAAGQGRTSPFGVTVSCRAAQPPMHGFG